MYQINEFSKISDVPKQTLRYYDSISLLKPKKIGEYNSYRYYTEEQLNRVILIKKMKLYGFKLDEIASVIDNNDIDTIKERKTNLEAEMIDKKRFLSELELIISSFDNENLDIKCEILKLTKIESNEENDMIEKYEMKKEKLMNCYGLYKEDKINECLVLLEELKHDIFNTEVAMDPFWDNAAGDVFTGITFEVFKNNEEKDVNFFSIYNFMINGKEVINDITEYYKTLDKKSYSYLSLSTLNSSPKETASSIVAVYKQKMKNIAMFETTK